MARPWKSSRTSRPCRLRHDEFLPDIWRAAVMLERRGSEASAVARGEAGRAYAPATAPAARSERHIGEAAADIERLAPNPSEAVD
jgi:hypothetical protein